MSISHRLAVIAAQKNVLSFIIGPKFRNPHIHPYSKAIFSQNLITLSLSQREGSRQKLIDCLIG